MTHIWRFTYNAGQDISFRDGRTDYFPHTRKLLHISPYSSCASISSTIRAIQASRWDYAITNTRVLEWVAIEILNAILYGSDIALAQSHLEDDIRHHTDALVKYRFNLSTFAGIDLTFGKDEQQRKIENEKKWKRLIHINWQPNKVSVLPHGILYMRWKYVADIAALVEKYVKNARPNVDAVKGWIRDLVYFLIRQHWVQLFWISLSDNQQLEELQIRLPSNS